MPADRKAPFRSADGLAGLFFVGLGGFFFVQAFDYSMGSARDIGPGFFPALAGGVLTVLGLAVIARSMVSSPSVGVIAWRPLIGVIVPVVLFAVTLKTLGLALAAALLVAASLFITRQASVVTALALAAALALFAVGVFGFALQLPLRLWPW